MSFKDYLDVNKNQLDEARNYGKIVTYDNGILIYANRESQIPKGLTKKGNDGVIETYIMKNFSDEEYKASKSQIKKIFSEFDKKMKRLGKDETKKLQLLMDDVEFNYNNIIQDTINKIDDLKR